jgi:ribosomal protein S14
LALNQQWAERQQRHQNENPSWSSISTIRFHLRKIWLNDCRIKFRTLAITTTTKFGIRIFSKPELLSRLPTEAYAPISTHQHNVRSSALWSIENRFNKTLRWQYYSANHRSNELRIIGYQ